MSREESGGIPRDCLRAWSGIKEALDDSQPLVDPRQLMRLSHVIEGEIIPRLMMLLESDGPAGGAASRSVEDISAAAIKKARSPITRNTVNEFVDLLLRNDAAVAVEYVQKLRDSGVALPTIYLDLLAPAARRLGRLWETDECDFTTVTIGTSRMHQVLLRFSPCFRSPSIGPDSGRSALIVPLPGEQHTFGLHMVVEFFRRKGWDICSGCPDTEDQLLRIVGENRFDIVGCSVSAERHLDRLERQIVQLRRHSRNRNIRVLVGGRLFNEQPKLFSSVGADATARDGERAVSLAASLVSAC